MFGASFLVLWATVSDSWTDSTAALEYVCRKVYTSQKKKKKTSQHQTTPTQGSKVSKLGQITRHGY